MKYFKKEKLTILIRIFVPKYWKYLLPVSPICNITLCTDAWLIQSWLNLYVWLSESLPGGVHCAVPLWQCDSVTVWHCDNWCERAVITGCSTTSYSVTTESVPTPPVSQCRALSLYSSVLPHWNTVIHSRLYTPDTLHTPTLPRLMLTGIQLGTVYHSFPITNCLCGGHWVQVSLNCGMYRL